MKFLQFIFMTVFFMLLNYSSVFAEESKEQETFIETQYAISKVSCDEYQQQDKLMNTLYQGIKKAHKKDRTFLRRFKKSQRYWLKFRDAHLNVLYPKPEKDKVSASSFTMCRCITLTAMTEQRNAQLRQILIPEEGDVCSAPRPVADDNE